MSDPFDAAPRSELREEYVEVLRTARVALLGGEGGAASVWYALHGYRQLAHRFLRRFRIVAGPDRLLVAPEGLSRFYLAAGDRPHGDDDAVGASWMTREDRLNEIADYVRYLDRLARTVEPRGGPPQGAPPPVRTVLGFSQGAHTAARWAVGGSVRPDRLVLWGAGFPGDLPEGAAERLRGVEIVLVRGESDHLRDAEEEAREVEWLEGAGLPYRILPHPHGHRIESEVLKELATPG